MGDILIKTMWYKAISILLTAFLVIVVIAYSPKAYSPYPYGTIVAFGGTSAPSGYLLCDGSAISRTTYAGLFAVIGTAYGVGDGSTTFNIPDLRQRFPLGKASSGTGSTLGGTGGAIDHTHDISHTHQVDPPNTTSSTPTGTVAATNLTGTAASTTHTHDVNIAAFTSGAASTSTSGTANAPFLAVNYIIKL